MSCSQRKLGASGASSRGSPSCLGQKSPDPAASWAVVVFLVHSRDGVVPLSAQSVLKEINPEYSLEELMLKLKLQNFGYLMQRGNSLEKTLMVGKIEGRRKRGTTEDEMVGWHHQLNGHECEKSLGDSE